ncbi:MAG: 2'-5' RNA ligase family protein [Gaiellaceae bacterium]
MPPEHALVVPFPGLVEPVGIANDLPPHVTVLFPCPDDVSAIGDVLAPFGAFDVTFARLERFPGTLWLAPEPGEPFVAMTEAMVERWPDHQPYGGSFDTIVPHLSVAQGQLDETETLLEPLLPLRSRAESVVLYERAGGDHWREVQTFAL